MDGMALLCTLHARGPTTLERLRNAGVRSLDELPALRDEELARILGCSAAAARRFTNEARHLAGRLGAGEPSAPRPAALERTPGPPRGPAVAPALYASPAAWVHAAREPEVELQPAQRSAAQLPTWPLHARPERAASPASTPQPPERAPAGWASGEELRPGLLAGLTPELCQALAQAGVRSAAQLERAADLALARRIGLSFPKLLDLAHQAGAQRTVAPPGACDPARDASAPERVSVGPPSAQEVGVGGPFI